VIQFEPDPDNHLKYKDEEQMLFLNYSGFHSKDENKKNESSTSTRFRGPISGRLGEKVNDTKSIPRFKHKSLNFTVEFFGHFSSKPFVLTSFSKLRNNSQEFPGTNKLSIE